MTERPKTDLTPLLAPQSIAVVGASSKAGSFGHNLYTNLRDSGFQGVLYPVNPNRKYIETVPTVPDLASLPEPVDLAILLVPAHRVPDVARLGVDAGKVRSLLVLAGGFREAGPKGAKYEDALLEVATGAGIPLCGPNCVGVINTDPKVRMHGMFADRPMPQQGRVAFISQSGALCLSILDAARTRGLGFSKFMSIGNKADVNELDLLRHLATDDETGVILMYIEELSYGREFIEVAREITLERGKPIFALKSGRSPQGAQAARSHTGSLAGSDAAYRAILGQSGIHRVDTIDEMFDYATGFESQPLLEGSKIAVVTNSGGPGIIATDSLVKHGLEIAEFSEETSERLRGFLPPHASTGNPCDLTGDADEQLFEKTLQVVLDDDNVDGAIVILTPVTPGADAKIAEATSTVATASKKTTFFCFLGVSDFTEGIKVLHNNGLPHFPFPENAVRALAHMPWYREVIELKHGKGVPTFEVDRDGVRKMIQEYLKDDDHRLLSQHQAHGIFEAYGLPVMRNRLAESPEDAAKLYYSEFTRSVAMKVMSRDVIHKSDVGGVILGVDSAAEATDAYKAIEKNVRKHQPDARIDGVLMEEMAGSGVEVIIGGSRDEKFGPMIMFGIGGRMVEVWKDVNFRLAPMWKASATRMIRQIRGYKLFEGVRGAPPSDVEAAEECILRLAQLMDEHPEIQELDINPLILYARGDGAAVADGRMAIKRLPE
ncbi:MAG: acetate--CoA ligase family protein [Myxococcota bacterium]|nr:acetate--CoA ligase family protein [Myxococcota bacterium]